MATLPTSAEGMAIVAGSNVRRRRRAEATSTDGRVLGGGGRRGIVSPREITATTKLGSAIVQTPSTAALRIGRIVAGLGITANTTIREIRDETTFVLSDVAMATLPSVVLTVDEFDSPHPLGPALPALYQEDEFTQRLLKPFDISLAPIFATLDCFPTYLDPYLSPEDFLPWLAGWVGVALDETWPIERRRALVADAVELFTMRGTVVGMKRQLELYTGGSVEIDDGGGTVASQVPEGDLPGYPTTHFVVRISIPRGARVHNRRINALIADGKPAHLTHELQVVEAAAAALAEPLPATEVTSAPQPAEPERRPEADGGPQ